MYGGVLHVAQFTAEHFVLVVALMHVRGRQRVREFCRRLIALQARRQHHEPQAAQQGWDMQTRRRADRHRGDGGP